MLGANPALAETPEYTMLPRQLRAEARRRLRPVPTPVEPTPPPVEPTPPPSVATPILTTVATPILTTLPMSTEPTPPPATPTAPPPTTPARPNTVKSKGGVPGAKTLPAIVTVERPKRHAGRPALVPEVVIETAPTVRVFYQVRQSYLTSST